MPVRAARPEDRPRLAALLAEMQAYYGATVPAPADIEAGLAGVPGGVELLVAEDGPALAGFAAISTLYPGPALQSGLFLKELFVSEPHRGRGFGHLLVQAVARMAVERGYGRVDWTADASQPRLLAFYRDLGGDLKTDRVFFRLEGDALAALGRRS